MPANLLSPSELEAIEGFAQAVSLPESKLDLAGAALWIASAEHPGVAIPFYLSKLDSMAEQAARRVAETPEPESMLRAINHCLYDELGFRGNQENYFDPLNSYLDVVMDRRRGIPITLAVIYLEIGWRLGVPLEGVGFPGHFLVKWAGREDLVVDAFDRGRLLNRSDCEKLLRRLFKDGAALEEHFLLGVSKRQILSRMLGNLKTIYVERSDYLRLLRVSELLYRLNPATRTEHRDRGLVLFRLDRLPEAYRELREYLKSPESKEDAQRVRAYLAEIQRRLSLRN